MVSIKKIFGSSGEGSHEDGGDLRHANPAGEKSYSGKASEAKSKNDELASRLTGKSSSDNVSHRKSLSNSSNTGLHSNSTSSNNRNSTTGYNTDADSTSRGTSSSPLSGAGVGAGVGAAGLGASSLGTSAIGGQSVDRDSKKTSDLLHATERDPHATVVGDRPIVGAVPVHSGKEGSSTNNPEFVLPGGTSGAHHSGLMNKENHLGGVDSGMRDNSNKESFTEAPRQSAPISPKRDTLERTGTGRLSKGSSGTGFANPHESGHVASSDLHQFDPKLATHDHQHLQHVTHREVRHVEIEEVERQREVDRHIHHVQTHVQPVLDKKILPEVISENIIAPTKVHERHASTAEDTALFESLATQHHNTESHRPKERTIVDLGERVTENVHHHVHHVTQPVIEQEIVERHRIHTVIPVHHVTHEAPIIHKSSTHAPVHLEDFLKGGGVLNSTKTYDNVGLLPEHDCERSVDGVAEKMISELNLKTEGTHYNGSSHAGHSHGSTSSNNGAYVSKDGDAHGSKAGQVVDNMTPSNNRVGNTQQI